MPKLMVKEDKQYFVMCDNSGLNFKVWLNIEKGVGCRRVQST